MPANTAKRLSMIQINHVPGSKLYIPYGLLRKAQGFGDVPVTGHNATRKSPQSSLGDRWEPVLFRNVRGASGSAFFTFFAVLAGFISQVADAQQTRARETAPSTPAATPRCR